MTPSPLLHVGMGYARAVLAPGPEAEALFRSALRVDLAAWPFARARVELALGGWLRRRRRLADARPPLRSARTTFDWLGTVSWAEQARAELRATGEAGRDRRVAPVEALTPQELQIAHLAASGLSDREIGQRLYLSPRTIGSHLYRIFPKLGVTARAQLAGRLGPPTG